MAMFIEIGAGAVVEKDGQVEGLGGLVQVEIKKTKRNARLKSMEKKLSQLAASKIVCFVLGSPRLPHGRRAKSSFEESGRIIWRKRRMSSAIERERTRLLDGHRDRHAWRL